MYHNTTVIGHVGRDPEMRYTPSGQGVTDFSVAVNEQFTDSTGEKVKKTVWYKVTTWGKLAEVCNQYVHKGDRVFVTGRLQADPQTGGPRIWTAQDGTPRTSFDLTADTVRFLNSRGEQAEHKSTPSENEPQPQEQDEPEFF